VVAARNEEKNIEACVGTLLEQNYPNYEVIAVDDRSDDRTPQLLRALKERGEGKLQVVTVRELREGWFGKNNAMREGVARSTGEWFCFTDADCWFTSDKALTVSIREAQAHQADFLTLLPPLDDPTTWERIVQPACAIMMISWFLPVRVNNPRTRIAYANGQFMLMNRACYEGIGGHERARSELNEDMAMARYAKAEGFRLRVAENSGLTNTRMYQSFAEAWHGWSRIFHGSIPSVAQLALAAFWHVVFAIGPWLSLVVALAGLAVAPASTRAFWAAAAAGWTVAVLAHQSVLWRVYGLMHFRRLYSWAHVLGSVVLVGMLINAITKTLGLTSTTWRGVTYHNGRLKRDAELPESPVLAVEDEVCPD
jgi:cellulose synthase/poly-beta-1,6-N-acetylglucosamine synthase-like glycosyltransferase